MSSLPLLNLPPNLPAEIAGVKIVDLRGQLPVNPKYTWESLKGNRDLKAISHVVLHHDAYPKKISEKWDDITLIKEIAGDHIRSKKNIPGGDPSIPYDCLIRHGTIYICNDLLPLKYGVASNNGFTCHLCVSGDYVNYDKLEDMDRNALYAAIFLYKSQLPNFKEICGHKELHPSSCPGYDPVQVRTNIAQIEKSMSLSNELDATPNNQIAQIYAGLSRFTDIYNTASKPGVNQAEAIRKSMLVIDAMVQSGILQK